MVQIIRNRLADTPFDAIWDAGRDLESVLEGVWGRAALPPFDWQVPADLVQTDEEIRCTLELPGVKTDDIQVVVENGVLTVAGEKKAEPEQGANDAATYHRERRYGRFERRFVLPRNVDPNRVSASYENGVLTVVLPRAEESKPRRVQINGSAPAQALQS